MSPVIINPGSGPVDNATLANAAKNMAAFARDLVTFGHTVGVNEPRTAHEGGGRYSFDLEVDGQLHKIDMPGIPLERVRFMNESDQDIWDFPRLYVDDSSWVWMFALSACYPDEDES